MRTNVLICLLLALATVCLGSYRLGRAADAELTDAVRSAVAEAAPSVLRVETFGGLEKVDNVLIGSGPTTGVAVSKDGYVLCSAYSFAKLPTSILVTMPSGQRVAAKIVARDHSRMLVLLKVNSDETLTPPSFVSRSELSVGQTAIAVGRTYDAETPNASVGIISATNRIWGKAVQTDAKISPANYGGPLIDLQGRVIGVLVPMSPQGEGVLAGAEWYDSGIGFAVPLAEIMPQLDRLKQGEDLQPGKLGISLAGSDNFHSPVEIAAVLPGSPAAKAGLVKGDRIVAVEGEKIRWLAHLKHAIGPRYSGETVTISVRRNDELLEKSVELIGEIAPYDVPFLGILPMRKYEGQGVKVRYVYEDSPAQRAGLRRGAVIQKCAGASVEDADQLRSIVGAHDKTSGPIELVFQHDGAMLTKAVDLASLPTAAPEALPPAEGDLGKVDERPPAGLVKIELPEIANACYAYVPENYNPKRSYGLIVWLHALGGFEADAIGPTWREVCETHNLIVVAPQAAEADAWQPTEAEFVRKAIDEAVDVYNIGGNRIVVAGDQAGGTFAALVAFSNEQLVRGVVMVDAPLPARVGIPPSNPTERMAFFIATADDSKVKDRIEADVERLRTAKWPVTVEPLEERSSALSEDERKTLGRWVDTLDRI